MHLHSVHGVLNMKHLQMHIPLIHRLLVFELLSII